MARAPGSRNRLVARRKHPIHAKLPMQRIERHQRDRRRAIRICNDPAVVRDVLPIDFGDHQRHLFLHPVCRRIVDDDRPRLHGNRAHTPARWPAPALKNARSTSSKEFTPSVWTASSWPRNLNVLPADRAEARSLTDVSRESSSAPSHEAFRYLRRQLRQRLQLDIVGT